MLEKDVKFEKGNILRVLNWFDPLENDLIEKLSDEITKFPFSTITIFIQFLVQYHIVLHKMIYPEERGEDLMIFLACNFKDKIVSF